jgi:hypothetical protein
MVYVKFEDGTKKRMKATEAAVILQQAKTLRRKEIRLYTNPYNAGVVHAVLVGSKGFDYEELWIEHVGDWGMHVILSEADVHEHGRYW